MCRRLSKSLIKLFIPLVFISRIFAWTQYVKKKYIRENNGISKRASFLEVKKGFDDHLT